VKNAVNQARRAVEGRTLEAMVDMMQNVASPQMLNE
jgi:hypothetical protein